MKNKIDFRDVTFMIPIKIDTPSRLKNLETILNYLRKSFISTFLVGDISLTTTKGEFSFCKYFHFSDLSERDGFNKTALLNRLALLSSSKYIAMVDCDILIPVSQFVTSKKLLDNGYDLVFPYDGTVVWMRGKRCRELQKNFSCMEKFDRNILSEFKVSLGAVGGSFIMERNLFLKYGGMNQNIRGHGPEDKEFHYRFVKLGFKVVRVEGRCYHLEHGRKTEVHDPHLVRKQQELNEFSFNKIRGIRKEKDLLTYINKFSWIDKLREGIK